MCSLSPSLTLFLRMHVLINKYMSVSVQKQNLSWYKRAVSSILPQLLSSPRDVNRMKAAHAQASELLELIQVILYLHPRWAPINFRHDYRSQLDIGRGILSFLRWRLGRDWMMLSDPQIFQRVLGALSPLSTVLHILKKPKFVSTAILKRVS